MTPLHATAELLFAAIIVGAVYSIVRDIRAGLRDLASFNPPAAPSAPADSAPAITHSERADGYQDHAA